MLKRKQNKKKKGFTLIELVIVLAVLAIIALIAIPNFTKVRNDSLLKSDYRSAEQIRKITLMAISDETIPDTTEKYELPFDGKNFDLTTGTGISGYDQLLKDVKAPQVVGVGTFVVDVKTGGEVEVSYETAITIDGTQHSVLAK